MVATTHHLPRLGLIACLRLGAVQAQGTVVDFQGFADPACTNCNLVDGSLHTFKSTRADNDIGKLFSAGDVANSGTTQTALQIAVWELACETAATHDVNSGAARFFGVSAADPGGAPSPARECLSQLSSITHTADVQVLESVMQGNIQGHQDQVFVARVPEPSSIALALAVLLGSGIALRRRSHWPRSGLTGRQKRQNSMSSSSMSSCSSLAAAIHSCISGIAMI